MIEIYFKKQPETLEKIIDQLEEQKNKLEYDISFFNLASNTELKATYKEINRLIECAKNSCTIVNEFKLLQPNMILSSKSKVTGIIDKEKTTEKDLEHNYVSLSTFLRKARYIGKRGFRTNNKSNNEMGMYRLNGKVEVLYITIENMLIRYFDNEINGYRYEMINQNLNIRDIIEYGFPIYEYNEGKDKVKILNDIYDQVTNEIKMNRK